MKVAFILPGIGKKHNEKYLKSWLMEPLTIAVLNKLLPKKYERVFYDDRIESIDFDAYKLHKTKKEEWEDFECTLLTISV